MIRAETFYAGRLGSWSRYGGSVFVMISGPKVADVKSGLAYAKDFSDNRTELCCFDGDQGTAFYAQCVPRAGKFFRDFCGIEEGTAYAYLVGRAPSRQTMRWIKRSKPVRPASRDIGIRRHTQTPAAPFWPGRNQPAGQRLRPLWRGCALPSNIRWKYRYII